MNRERYYRGMTLDEAIEAATRNQDFWRGTRRLARVPPELQQALASLPGTRHLLALSEDWCTDAVNTLPIIARLIEEAPNVDLRVVPRDANPDLMNAHLTRGTRSIPVVIVYDETFTELGWWGPRPSVLQQWHYDVGQLLESKERGLKKREWYARDRGASTAREFFDLLRALAVKGTAHGSVSG